MYPVADPLCPAGHLPHKGGDQLGARSQLTNDVSSGRCRVSGAEVLPLVISPLVGEMVGRPEGGNAAANIYIPLWEEHP
ncbi:hypothetical protein GGE35_003928 [Rhizobium cellulosilyticum]|uniref:Lytic murein transglycosylase n=1 Tax=Aliirhizobium cellulosilyticum TaxID=393664 RepID=A0A7W6WRU7_9HYPH|nr:hypothetical protein [Rhizobium cellulosilyticum]MBB4413458.1 hypothetical protein [Rhizobium cellulosilyticum]MBB4448091.1 hypothetical protein [Rhizobium cellulosilyticum]